MTVVSLEYPNLPANCQSFKITEGFKVSVIHPVNTTLNLNGRQHGYYKHGFSLAMKDWLESNVGETINNHFWQFDGKGDWIHTGSRWSSKKKPEDEGIKIPQRDFVLRQQLLLDFYFRDRHKAALFVVRWDGYL